MNLNEFTDQQERLTRLEALEDNAEWLKENWEAADSAEISKRLGTISGDVNWLMQLLSDTGTEPEGSVDE